MGLGVEGLAHVQVAAQSYAGLAGGPGRAVRRTDYYSTRRVDVSEDDVTATVPPRCTRHPRSAPQRPRVQKSGPPGRMARLQVAVLIQPKGSEGGMSRDTRMLVELTSAGEWNDAWVASAELEPAAAWAADVEEVG